MVNSLLKLILAGVLAFFLAQILLAKPFVLLGLMGFGFLMFLSVHKPLWFLVSLVVVQERLFQSIDIGISIYMYTDLAIVLLGGAIVLQFLLHGWPKDLHKNFYFLAILSMLAIILFSIFFGSGVVHNQPVKSLIFRGRPYFLCLVFLYLAQVRFSTDQIKSFMRYVIWSAFIVAVLVIVEVYIFRGNTLFQMAWDNGVSGFREGRVRVFTYTSILGMAYYYLLSLIYYEPKTVKKILYGIMWGAITYQYVFCNMTRSSLVVMGVATLLFVLTRNSRFKFQLAGVGVMVLMMYVLFSPANSGKSGFFNDMVTLTQNEAKSRSSGNIAVRLQGIDYYYPYFKQTGFLGMGIMSTTYPGSPVYKGGARGYLFSDIAFFATLFRFGIPALIFFIVVMFRQFKDLLAILKSKDYKIRSIACGRIFPLITGILFLPLNPLFFGETGALYVGILFYFIFRLKESLALVPAVKSAGIFERKSVELPLLKEGLS